MFYHEMFNQEEDDLLNLIQASRALWNMRPLANFFFTALQAITAERWLPNPQFRWFKQTPEHWLPKRVTIHSHDKVSVLFMQNQQLDML